MCSKMMLKCSKKIAKKPHFFSENQRHEKNKKDRFFIKRTIVCVKIGKFQKKSEHVGNFAHLSEHSTMDFLKRKRKTKMRNTYMNFKDCYIDFANMDKKPHPYNDESKYQLNLPFSEVEKQESYETMMEFLEEILPGNVDYFLGRAGFLLTKGDSTHEILVFHGDIDTIRVLFGLIGRIVGWENIETVPLKEYLDPCNSYRFNSSTLFNISLYDDEIAKEYLKKDIDIYRTFDNMITEGSYPKMVFISKHYPETLEAVRGEYTADFEVMTNQKIYDPEYLQKLYDGVSYLCYALVKGANDIVNNHTYYSFGAINSIELPKGNKLELII